MNFLRFLFSKTLLVQLILAFLVGILFVYLTLSFLKNITLHNEYQKVPDLKGISLINLPQITADKNLRYEIIDSSKFTPNLPPLSVIEHQPSPGQMVKKNRMIYVTLNPSSYRRISVPDVVQITRRNAEVTLLSVGFSIGEISYRNNIGKDMVLEMRYRGELLEAGTLLQKTAAIDLVLGNGKRN
ncbi:MAG: penicillin-binding protein [Flavobacteriaceae bacterium]|jgi:beta-lactam-binding protein with PASTA domain|nr:penicillin-binding protein [Flavobacteriaceae bacterium]